MSIQAVSWALDLNVPDAGAKLVLVALANHADHKTGECFPTVETLSKEASASERTVQRKIAMLIEWGLVEKQPDLSEGRQRANTYRINLGRDRILDLDEGCQSVTPQNPSRGDTCVTGEGVTCVTPGGVTGVTPLKEPSEETVRYNSDASASPPLCVVFSDFQEAYAPRSAGDEIGRAKGAWEALTPEQRARAVRAAGSYCRSRRAIGKDPMFSTVFLRDRHFEITRSESADVAVEWIAEGSERWRQLIASGKKESLLRTMLRKHDGQQCFPHYGGGL